MSYTEDLLKMIENDPDFVDSVITDDESCCFPYNPLAQLGLVQYRCLWKNFASKN